LDDGVDGVRFFGSAMRGNVTAVGQAVFTVEPVGRGMGADERFSGADTDRRSGVTEFGNIEGVPRGLVDGDVACDGSDGADVDVRMAESHDERDGVVGGGIGVDEKREFLGHGRRIAEEEATK
jgi:hypothetical protein